MFFGASKNVRTLILCIYQNNIAFTLSNISMCYLDISWHVFSLSSLNGLTHVQPAADHLWPPGPNGRASRSPGVSCAARAEDGAPFGVAPPKKGNGTESEAWRCCELGRDVS